MGINAAINSGISIDFQMDHNKSRQYNRFCFFFQMLSIKFLCYTYIYIKIPIYMKIQLRALDDVSLRDSNVEQRTLTTTSCRMTCAECSSRVVRSLSGPGNPTKPTFVRRRPGSSIHTFVTY